MATYSIGPCGCCGGNSNCASLIITYDWSNTSSNDLDTGTTFLGTKAGWACGPDYSYGGSEYLIFLGDEQGSNSSESVIINFKAARDANLWSNSVAVDLAAGWYVGAYNGGGQIVIRVNCVGGSGATEQTKTVMPGIQGNCASTNVGSVTIYENGTFTLS